MFLCVHVVGLYREKAACHVRNRVVLMEKPMWYRRFKPR